MALHKVLLSIDWPTLFCFLVHVLSTSALPILIRLLLTRLHFPFPVTLGAVHTLTIAICLWFWTILSIFKPRTIPFFSTVLPLSLYHALTTMLHFSNMYINSLLHFQIARFLPLLLLLNLNNNSNNNQNTIHKRTSSSSSTTTIKSTTTTTSATLFLSAVTVLVFKHPPSSPFLFFLTVFTSCLDRFFPLGLRMMTKATDLQLQLMIRTFSAIWLSLIAPYLDSNFVTTALLVKSPKTTRSLLLARMVALDHPTAFFIYSTALLAFFTFVSVRVAHAKLHPIAFRSASIVSAIPPLIVHFVVDTTPGLVDGPAIVLFLIGAHHVMLECVNDGEQRYRRRNRRGRHHNNNDNDDGRITTDSDSDSDDDDDESDSIDERENDSDGINIDDDDDGHSINERENDSNIGHNNSIIQDMEQGLLNTCSGGTNENNNSHVVRMTRYSEDREIDRSIRRQLYQRGIYPRHCQHLDDFEQLCEDKNECEYENQQQQQTGEHSCALVIR